MLAVQVELLTGRYVATQFNNRNRAEWPPHPARLFSAAVAIWADADVPDPDEHAALIWWERQGQPSITCDWSRTHNEKTSVGDWAVRSEVTHFVPVNDTQVVGRDLSMTYNSLREAVQAATDSTGTGGPPKTAERLARKVEKLTEKAAGDSSKAASRGVAPTSAIGVLPDHRGKQARVYPTVIPNSPTVTYAWPDTDEQAPETAVLDRLLARIGRLGHSSSFVSVSVMSSAPAPTLVPHPAGQIGLRVAGPGQLDALERAFASHQGVEPRTLPAEIAPYQAAGEQVVAKPSSTFDDTNWIVLELIGGQFTSRDTLALARATRGALMHHSERQPPPEIISGHRPGVPTDGPTPPSQQPHLAFVPLPFAGHPHADGLVRAIALILPTRTNDGDRLAVLTAAGRWVEDGSAELRIHGRPVTKVAFLDAVNAPASARVNRWCRPSSEWVTVTPIALDRHPGDLAHHDQARRLAAEQAAQTTIRAACRNIGLPEPVEVAVRTDAPVIGTRPTRGFPPYTVQNGRLRRMLIHASVRFSAPVAGPLLLGAGRYLGYGLCIPVDAPHDREVQQ